MGASAALSARLGIPFRDPALLDEALVHASYPNEHPGDAVRSNERLEFLGDAVVALIISEAVHARHPRDDEGRLTARRAAIVSTEGLSRIARRLDLGAYLRVGQGAERSHTRSRDSVLASTLEAVAAAVYLDQGLDAARAWLVTAAGPELATEDAAALIAPKSRLQTLSYALDGRAPEYEVLSTEGPEHERHYVIQASVGGEVLGRGEGRSHREAETAAARAALERLGVRGSEPGAEGPAGGPRTAQETP